MLPDGRRIGLHVALGAGMARAVDRAASIGASTIQLFADNPTAWRRRADLPADLPKFRARVEVHGLAPLAIHAAYLVNLAGPDDDLWERSVQVLIAELRMAEAYGARFVNVHIGSHRGAGAEAGAERLAAGVRRVLAAVDAGRSATARPEDPPLLVLENGAGGGFGLGATMEDLGRIDAALDAGGIPSERVGFCLDTAHLWGAGYPVDRADGVDATLAAFDAAVGVARLRMIHLNDSRSEPGSKTDRHEHIGAGRIGGEGLARMLTHPALAHAAYYLETPGMDEGYDAVNLARALDLAAGRPLAPLPPEAFALTSSRTKAVAPPEAGGGAPHPRPRPRRTRASEAVGE